MHKYLSNILEKEGATEFIQRLKNEPIEIIWHVACYHYETRTRVVQTIDSNETYQEKVYTWNSYFILHHWRLFIFQTIFLSAIHGSKELRSSKQQKLIKLKSNYQCLTLELSNNINIPNGYKSKLIPTEISYIKTRKDNNPGHNIETCPKLISNLCSWWFI